ncbi:MULTISPECIES: type II toxin-antitoxin system RelE/ParE family toxin [Flavobacteriaceae]|jgi:proteic killer suppression protein|uniref:Killer suppression protein HigA n=1 Tax=Aequorivita soesokkakensis TaxID=1385699 RepID=A0A1A9LBA9_9FLAO|nr:type II toxin-antitoxin system RelE/ParE family toxin [Aequorivita soesokkakensis]OAD90276.1 killer suppression protein HigA [Aequorivita soesokkakensis]
MDILFGNNKLEKYANSDREGYKKLGVIRFKIYKKRLDQIRAAKNLEDLRYSPGRFHELKENRKGEWACDLDQPYRLIFIPQENPIPTDNHGKFIWVEILGVEIIEIEDYH